MKRVPGLAAVLVVAAIGPALASQVLPGTYASWNSDQKVQAARLLKSGSTVECESYLEHAPDSQLSSYEAAACVSAYFYNHLPPDYPGLEAIRNSAIANYKNAKSLGSNIPVLVDPTK